MFEFLDHQNSEIIGVRVSGKVDRDTYREMLEKIEEQIAVHKPVRILFELKDFEGWGPRVAWEDLKFDIRHNRDVSRAAIVGDRKWEEVLTGLLRPLAHADVRYFDLAEEDEAWRWIEAPVVQKVHSGIRRKEWNALPRRQKAALIAAATVQVSLLAGALYDLYHRPARRIRGPKKLWAGLVFINFIGPLAYFLVGRKG